MSAGNLFLSAILAEGSAPALLKRGEIYHLFKAHEIEVYEWVKEYVKQYHVLPNPDTILAHIGQELPAPKEPSAYYFEIMQHRHIEMELKRAGQKMAELLSADHKAPLAALEVMTRAVMELIAHKNHNLVVDFRDAYHPVISAYSAKFNEDDDAGIRFGWPTLDSMTGGLMPGDMASMVGRPQSGKTMEMLYAAHTPWRKQKRRVLFVTMEMKPIHIEQRLAALEASIPMTWLKNGVLTTNSLNKLKGGLTEIKGFEEPFWIVDGNFTATVDDVWAAARQLKPDAIYIDGAYLLKHPKERDRYKRVAENADLIKQQLSDLAPTICSWQFSRDAAKKSKTKGTGHVGLEHIGYSDVIAQVSSLVLGLFEEESPATVKQRRIEILKGRNGETGHFFTRWDWMRMRFDEVLEEPIQLLQVA
jgi:replicative DNA helicase